MAVDTVQYIASWLGQHDIPDKVIAGILGNMQVESSDSTSALNGHEGAIGLVQWEGGRRAGLDAYAKSKGTSETDLNTQLEYLWKELNGPYKGALTAMEQAPDAQSAAAAFDQYYEVSSGSSRAQRMADAQSYAVNGFHGGGAVPAAMANSTIGGSTAAGTTTGGASLDPAQERAALLAGVGPLSSLLTSVPELNALLNKAISTGMTSAEFQNAITDTKWYRTHNQNVRDALALQASDPASYQQMLRQEQAKVQLTASQMGVTINSQQLAALANQSYTQGMTPQQLQKQLAGMFNRSNISGMGGQAAQIFAQLKQAAGDYGQQWSDQTTAFRTQQVLGGGATVDNYSQELKQNAKAMYPSLAGQIDNGLTIKDIANPYVAAKANILEMDPATINWATDTDVKKALQGTNTPNGQNTGMSPMSAFEESLRANPKWQYTANARDAASTALLKLGQDFGFAS
jgi:hypothetical protein